MRCVPILAVLSAAVPALAETIKITAGDNKFDPETTTAASGDILEFHFGAAGSRLRQYPGFRMRYVPEADHTFSRPGNQSHVLPLLLDHLERRPAAALGQEPEPMPATEEAAAAWL